MKKLLSLILLLAICQVIDAQRVDKPGAAYDYFCMVHWYNNKASIITDKNVESEYIHDEDGNVVLFDSDVEIINYMTKRGWIFVESVGLTGGSTVYLLKKNITTEKNVFQGILKIKNETKKEKRIMERPEDIQRKSAKEGLLNN